MLYSAHQPDLLPYSGFFYKMANADVFDLKIWDQYVNRGYQRRVMMRGPLGQHPAGARLLDRLDLREAGQARGCQRAGRDGPHPLRQQAPVTGWPSSGTTRTAASTPSFVRRRSSSIAPKRCKS